MPIPKKNNSESKYDYIIRCMSDDVMKSEYKDVEQRYAICSVQLAKQKISFDYDDTLSTKKGTEKALELIKDNVLYIISARSEKDGMLKKAESIGIPESKVYATGSNKAKIEKVLELGIDIHYDNNKDVLNELKGIGRLFE